MKPRDSLEVVRVSRRRRYGPWRYRVTLGMGMPYEFLVERRPRESIYQREWVAVFANAVAQTLAKQAAQLKEKP